MGLLSRLLRAVLGPLPEPDELTAARTLCCDVPMYDMWMHAPGCPNMRAVADRLRRGGDARPVRGCIDGNCPHCGFPGTQFFGIYTVGDKCPWCGYVEDSCAPGPGARQVRITRGGKRRR